MTALVWGAADIGKSALAVHWGHRHRDAFPEGQLYVNLRGFDPSGPPMPTVDAVRVFISALGCHRSAFQPAWPSVSACTEPSSPASGGGSRVVITSRNPMVGLVATDAARPIVLDVLSRAEARELLRSAAKGAWRKAVAILDDMDHPRADQVRERLATAAI